MKLLLYFLIIYNVANGQIVNKNFNLFKNEKLAIIQEYNFNVGGDCFYVSRLILYNYQNSNLYYIPLYNLDFSFKKSFPKIFRKIRKQIELISDSTYFPEISSLKNKEGLTYFNEYLYQEDSTKFYNIKSYKGDFIIINCNKFKNIRNLFFRFNNYGLPNNHYIGLILNLKEKQENEEIIMKKLLIKKLFINSFFCDSPH